MEPTVERFCALARSSPWRWSTLRYVQLQAPYGRAQEPVRVWIRRPKLARVERLDGTLLKVSTDDPPTTVARLSRGRSAGLVQLPPASDTVVELDSDGFVRRRPDPSDADADTAIIYNYYDVAVLDPRELADGRDDAPGTLIEDLRVVDHHGRDAWEATLRPTADYDARCPCCALLLSDLIEDGGVDLRLEDDPTFTYPDAHRVRLDVATGVCVANEQLGGTHDGAVHELAIEAVDEPMGDELFPPPEPSRRSRFFRRS
jgi:hypothetical protein